MQNANINKRCGDECYTPAYVVEKLQKEYDLYGKNIWLPFCVESSPFFQVLKKDNNVILSPEHTKTYLRENLSLFKFDLTNPYKFKKTNAPYYYDFNLAIRNKEFISKIQKEKFIVFDNPPFTDLAKKIFWLNYFNIPFYLFSNAMTVSSIYMSLRNENINLGFSYIPKIKMINGNYTKEVAITILTNTSTKMKGCFALNKKTTKPLIKQIDKNKMSCLDLFQYLRRGYEFDMKDYQVVLEDRMKFGGYYFQRKEENVSAI